MSVQFGRWSFAGESPEREYMEKVSACIAPYGPDSCSSYLRPGIEILYRGFHTTKEARREKQPHVCSSGAVITWDGRLDNRDELIDELRPRVSLEDSDVTLVGTAFESWGTECFAKLIGDWALSIWDARQRSLILAKDPIGPRHLYYSVEDEQITWCTVLDPLVLFAGKKFKLCEEYLAGWLSLYPATQLTPYVGIQAVSPARCVFLGPRKHIIVKYWDFDPDKRIRYRTDAEYEEHFRSVFFQAVRRRLRSDAPVLAELSGGRDSSSIVCVADEIMARGEAEPPSVDTMSCYDDSEPNWNERPYFSLIERKRGRTGWHINTSSQIENKPSDSQTRPPYDFLTPTSRRNHRVSSEMRACMKSGGNRVVISGIGGDEIVGGVPTPIPELQDLVVTARLGVFGRQLIAWALAKRQSCFQILFEIFTPFLSLTRLGGRQHMRPPSWLQPKFTIRHRSALTGYYGRLHLFGPLPTFQDNMSTLNCLRRQLASGHLTKDLLHEKRYPFLDRTFLEFMFAIPREQSIRPTQRRSLMRRALVGIVPTEILDRKMKAVVARAPLVAISTNWKYFADLCQHLISQSLGIIDSERFLEALQRARCGRETYWLPIVRALYIEEWLQGLAGLGLVDFQMDRDQELVMAVFTCTQLVIAQKK